MNTEPEDIELISPPFHRPDKKQYQCLPYRAAFEYVRPPTKGRHLEIAFNNLVNEYKANFCIFPCQNCSLAYVVRPRQMLRQAS